MQASTDIVLYHTRATNCALTIAIAIAIVSNP